MKKVYLDNAATTRSSGSDIVWYNPNSAYEYGRKCRDIINFSRRIVARFLNVDSSEIIFTPSASFSNSFAILGYLRKHNKKIYACSEIEHDSVRKINANGISRKIIHVDQNGFVDMEEIKKLKNCLVSIGMANSEVGTIQDIKTITSILHKHNCVVHTDITQYLPHFTVNLKDLDVDMATFSGHKLGAMRGLGVLYVKSGIELEPIVFGHQENGMVGGTENTEAIESLAFAIQNYNSNSQKHSELKRYVEFLIRDMGMRAEINGDMNCSIPSIVSIYCKSRLTGDQIVQLMDERGFMISSGSACNSYNLEPSETLMAMYNDEYRANHTIRISFGDDTTHADIKNFMETLNSLLILS